MNPAEYFDDLSPEELDNAERVAKRRADEAITEYRRERAKLREIQRVRRERDAK